MKADALVTQRMAELIALHENCRLFPYPDTEGKITIGWGYNLTDRGITQTLADQWRDTDIATSLTELRRNLPWFDGLDPVRKVALGDMHYNMGAPTFMGFRRMLAAAEKRQWKTVGAHAMASKWFLQVKSRGPRIVGMLITGQWPTLPRA